ncbi:MAG: dihydrodipicolinate synthase family protein [Acidobacteria bacterium]|nr:MAG: dihydrodipicolinate synthase family protein [Acidobacteriota bacterium]
MDIRGVIPPVITPFKENGDIDFNAHVRNIESWNACSLAGYLALGSNSEAVYLTTEEKIELLQVTAKSAAPGRIILAGTGAESTRETISLTNEAARAGAQAALVLTPFYYWTRMTEPALIAHFTQLADAADIPVLLYNVPKFTHLNISRRAVEVLSQHPNIIGMKDSSGDVAQLASFQSVIPAGFNLAVGTASAWYPALALGVTTGILALANCCPKECVEVQRLWEAGRNQEAQDLYRRLLPVNTAVTATFGIAGLKFAADLLGFRGGTVRSPLQELTGEEQLKLRQILVVAGLLGS